MDKNNDGVVSKQGGSISSNLPPNQSSLAELLFFSKNWIIARTVGIKIKERRENPIVENYKENA